MPEGRESVNQHAEKIIEKHLAGITPDADAIKGSAAFPSFSGGTVTLDDKSGKPVGPPVAQEAPPQTIEPGAQLDPSPDRPMGGKAPDKAEIPGAVVPVESQQSATEVAAPVQDEAAAIEAAVDEWADAEEIEYDDGDTGQKFKVRAPKAYAQAVKNGYMRRSTMDRSIMYAKQAEPVLRDLITSGELKAYLPLIQRAKSDPAFDAYVVRGYQNLLAGRPLEQGNPAPQAAQAPVQQPQSLAPLPGTEELGPFEQELLRPALERVARLEEMIQKGQQTVEQQRAEQQKIHDINERRGNELQAGHQDLARMYPDRFSGDLQRDQHAWKEVCDFVRNAGYEQAYGLRSGVIFAAQQLMAARAETTASPTAEYIANIDQAQVEAAARESAQAARAIRGGTPASVQRQAPAAPAPVTTVNADGSRKSVEQFMAEAAERVKARVSARS